MKKIKALMFAFVLAGMTVVSCSDDDNGPAATIDGKWNQVKTVVRINNGSNTDIPYTDNQPGCDKDYVEFASGGVFNDVVYIDPAGSVDCEADFLNPGVWSRTNDNLIIVNEGDLAGTHKIVRLTNSELQISRSAQIGAATTTSTIFLTRAK